MESTNQHPSAIDASAALDDAVASRTELARRLRTPPLFFTSIGIAIAIQIASAAVAVSWSVGAEGITAIPVSSVAVFAAGVVILLVVASLQLRSFRQLNGVWLDGLVSHVVLGTGALASGVYVVALFAAIWASLGPNWWLVAACSIAGGIGYALAGRRWLDDYRVAPARHTRGTSTTMLLLAGVVAVAGVALLVLYR